MKPVEIYKVHHYEIVLVALLGLKLVRAQLNNTRQ